MLDYLDFFQEILSAEQLWTITISRSSNLMAHEIRLHPVGRSCVLDAILKCVAQRVYGMALGRTQPSIHMNLLMFAEALSDLSW